MTNLSFHKIAQLAAFALFGLVFCPSAPQANAQLATCINQCDALAYQCERNVNDEYQRCMDDRDSRIQVCEQEGNDKRNYCIRNRAPSCDLSGQFAFNGCMNFVQSCELNGQRCDASIRTCVARCENEAAAAQPRNRPAPQPKPAVRTQPKLSAFEADRLAAQQPEIRVYKFEHSDQLNEFKLVDEDFLYVRNLRPAGNHGKWHKYTRESPIEFKATTSNATYTLADENTFVWTHGDQTITLIRQNE